MFWKLQIETNTVKNARKVSNSDYTDSEDDIEGNCKFKEEN